MQGGTLTVGMISDWPSMAACQSGDPDALFVQGAAQNRAKAICMGCPVRTECLADALDNRIQIVDVARRVERGHQHQLSTRQQDHRLEVGPVDDVTLLARVGAGDQGPIHARRR